MMEITFSIALPNFMEIIHVELSNKGGIMAVLKVMREYKFGKDFLVGNNETNAIGCPSNSLHIFLILNK